jgi:hypothetical protein
MKDEFERLREEAVVAYSNVLSGNVCGGTEKTTRTFSQYNLRPCRNPNRTLCEHKSKA